MYISDLNLASNPGLSKSSMQVRCIGTKQQHSINNLQENVHYQRLHGYVQPSNTISSALIFPHPLFFCGYAGVLDF